MHTCPEEGSHTVRSSVGREWLDGCIWKIFQRSKTIFLLFQFFLFTNQLVWAKLGENKQYIPWPIKILKYKKWVFYFVALWTITQTIFKLTGNLWIMAWRMRFNWRYNYVTTKLSWFVDPTWLFNKRRSRADFRWNFDFVACSHGRKRGTETCQRMRWIHSFRG